jgi:hypothetical protein
MSNSFLVLLLLALLPIPLATGQAIIPELVIPQGLGHIRPYVDLADGTNVKQLEKQKSWNPMTETIPLQPYEAQKAAEKWLVEQADKPYAYRISDIQLHQCAEPLKDRWFYVVQFSGIQYHQSISRSVLVLFDRTVIVPKLVD